MKPDICIVSHCWRYSRLLAYQLSSLVLWPPKVRVQVVVCYTDDGDDKTWLMLQWFMYSPLCDLPSTVTICGHEMERRRLCRRAIGRNEVSLKQEADIVWFADGDYVFGPGCLDYIVENFPTDKTLTWPRYVLKCSHERGDQLIEAVTEPGIYEFPFSEAKPARPKRAIGGIQIVSGELARKIGYLNGSRRWQKPADRWVRTREDGAARRSFAPGVELDIPNVGRVRHSLYGREHIGVEN